MSIECSECERDLRGGHAPDCSRGKKKKNVKVESELKKQLTTRGYNECQNHPELSEDDYLALWEANLMLDGDIERVLSMNGHPNWTCCPQCGYGGFTHHAECELKEMHG